MLTYPLIGIGILFGNLHGDFRDHALGAMVGYAAFVLIELAYKRIRGADGLGRGDAKLLAAGGAWCGWAGLPFIVLIASGTGLVVLLLPFMAKYRESGRVPFGPFLAFAIGCYWLTQNVLTGL